MKHKIYTLILGCLIFFAAPVFATEKIEHFDSLIQVQPDGSMIVTETLHVHHEGNKIRRGIYRDLPTKKGEKYELIGVKRNNRHEPSFVERRPNYYRINTGDNSLLPHPRTSSFEIKYRVWNIPKSYKGYDEVYWNVTGDEWNFPIDTVTARVELPQGADILQQASYIGYQGSKEPAAYGGNGQYTGRHLVPGEQLTIAVGFTPGIVSTKKHATLNNYFGEHPMCLYFIYLIILVLIWYRKGKDPVGRAIMPQYTPPKEITAAQAACLYDMGVRKNLLAISFIQMIANGFLTLTKKTEKLFWGLSSNRYILERTDKTPSNDEEMNIFWKRKELTGRTDYELESEAKQLVKRTQKSVKYYYTTNQVWLLIPTVVAFVWLVVETYFIPKEPIFFLVLCAFALFFCVPATKVLHRKLPVHLLIYIVTNLVWLWVIFCIGRGTIDFNAWFHSDSVAVIVLILVTSSVFAYLMYQPTEKGQRLMEYLEGLRLFLTTTKSPIREQKTAEEKLTKENLEEIFPYALALGVEKEWAAKFKQVFGYSAYHSFVQSHPYASRSFVQSFSSATSHSSGGSGGGSGGGGCSGGGGGGGGGGGR